LNGVEGAAKRIGTIPIVSEFCSPRDNHLSFFLQPSKDCRFDQPVCTAELIVLYRELCRRLFSRTVRADCRGTSVGAAPRDKFQKLVANGLPVIKDL
jgi:hypothetical protein